VQGPADHGSKLAPVVGSSLALDGRTVLPIEFLSPKRFGG
jgi:hypothetical protein